MCVCVCVCVCVLCVPVCVVVDNDDVVSFLLLFIAGILFVFLFS